MARSIHRAEASCGRIDLSADTLNFDEIQKKLGGEPKKQGSLEDTLKGLVFPYDIDFDIGVQNATLNGQKITGLRADIRAP